MKCKSCNEELEPEVFMSDGHCIPCLMDDLEAKNDRIEELERQLEALKDFVRKLVSGLQKTAELE